MAFRPAPDLAAILDRVKAKASPKLRKSIEAALRNARGDFAELLKTMDLADAIEVAAIWEGLLDSLATLYGDGGPLLRYMTEAGEGVAHAAGLPWAKLDNGFALRAGNWLQEEGAKRVSSITHETRQAMRDVLQDSITGPKGLRKVAREIYNLPGLGLDTRQMSAFEKQMARYLRRVEDGDWTKSQFQFALDRHYEGKLLYRSRRLALTEASDAVHASLDMTMREAVARGEVDAEEYEWAWVTRTVNACPICEAFNDARRPLTGGVFTSRPVASGKYAGQVLTIVDPTVHPFCLCTKQAVEKGR